MKSWILPFRIPPAEAISLARAAELHRTKWSDGVRPRLWYGQSSYRRPTIQQRSGSSNSGDGIDLSPVNDEPPSTLPRGNSSFVPTAAGAQTLSTSGKTRNGRFDPLHLFRSGPVRPLLTRLLAVAFLGFSAGQAPSEGHRGPLITNLLAPALHVRDYVVESRAVSEAPTPAGPGQGRLNLADWDDAPECSI